MWTTTLKGIAGHKRRFLATCTAVVLGVSFLTATLVLGTTVERSFTDMFAEANAGTAAVVRDATSIGASDVGQRGTVDPEVVARVAAVDGVAAAVPVVQGTAQVIGTDGTPIGGQGPPTIGGTWIDVPELNPYQLAEGRAPEASAPGGPVEVVVDRATADTGDLTIGSTTVLQTPAPTRVRVVGIATFGDNDSMAGSTYAGMVAAEATRLLANGLPGASEVRVAAVPDTSDEELAERIRAAVPAGDEVLTGAQLTDEQVRQIDEDFLGMMTTMLLVFAGIALLVATFSIHNTFSIVAAQKARESALLRAIGATRGQVLGSVLLESLAVGLLATATGLGVGTVLAAGLNALLGASGVGLPVASLAVSAGSLAVGAVVGIAITVAAAIAPALQSSRVSPLAAMRASAVEATRIARARLVLGGLALAAGVGLVAWGASGDGELGTVGLGALVAIVGFLMLGPLQARGAARVVGLPGRLLRGVTGRLAQENAVRNPRRTASTATALVIGMGVVSLFTVFGASLQASIEDEVTSSFGTTDLVVEATSFAGSGIGEGFTDEVRSVDGVDAVAPLAFADVRLDGADEMATITDPVALDAVSDLGLRAGSIGALDARSIAVSEAFAEERGWAAGTEVTTTFADGTNQPVTVAAVYEARGALGDVIVPDALWDAHAVRVIGDQVVLIGLVPGTDLEAARSDVSAIAEGFGSPTVRDRQEYLDAVADQVGQMLVIVYVLLAVAVVIALLGIANTLSLSIHERTRELGVLRAVGQTRSQLRSTIRWEAIVVAVFGTLGGLGLGVLIGWGVVRAASGELSMSTVAVPLGPMAVVLVAGALVGVLAAVRPARRASRIDVLRAIATD
jgi:putative ABC transport system permease protein